MKSRGAFGDGHLNAPVRVLGLKRGKNGGHHLAEVDGATTQSTGLPDNNKSGGAWIMNAGTVSAHLMTPDDPPSMLLMAR